MSTHPNNPITCCSVPIYQFNGIEGMTTKQIKKYVAFNPASSEATEWWTADSLPALVKIFWAAEVTETEPTVRKFKKVCEGKYFIESIEIYNTQIHPAVKEVLE